MRRAVGRFVHGKTAGGRLHRPRAIGRLDGHPGNWRHQIAHDKVAAAIGHRHRAHLRGDVDIGDDGIQLKVADQVTVLHFQRVFAGLDLKFVRRHRVIAAIELGRTKQRSARAFLAK